MRTRDERFSDREHHTTAPNPLHDKSGTMKKAVPVFAPSDFTYDADARTGVCPAGKSLNRERASNVTNGYVGEHVRCAKLDGALYALRDRSVRIPTTTVVRNVAILQARGRGVRDAYDAHAAAT